MTPAIQFPGGNILLCFCLFYFAAILVTLRQTHPDLNLYHYTIINHSTFNKLLNGSFSIVIFMLGVSYENQVMSRVVGKATVGRVLSVCSALAKQCSQNQSQTGNKKKEEVVCCAELVAA